MINENALDVACEQMDIMKSDDLRKFLQAYQSALPAGWVERGVFYEATLQNGMVGSDLTKFDVALKADSTCWRFYKPINTIEVAND